MGLIDSHVTVSYGCEFSLESPTPGASLRNFPDCLNSLGQTHPKCGWHPLGEAQMEKVTEEGGEFALCQLGRPSPLRVNLPCC